jgi:hypothetical protein
MNVKNRITSAFKLHWLVLISALLLRDPWSRASSCAIRPVACAPPSCPWITSFFSCYWLSPSLSVAFILMGVGVGVAMSILIPLWWQMWKADLTTAS